MLIFVIFLGKSVLAALRLTGRHGSALPGLVVEKLYKPFLARTIGQLPYGVIVITGTNGKTTTTKTISELLSAQGLRVLTNSTGSNFVRGIIAATLDKIMVNGTLPYDVAVLEQDEAHAVQLVREVAPKGVVALNVMRDQMDRFGEIDTTAKLMGRTIAAATDWVVLNANDPRVASLERQVVADNKYWFGHSKELLEKYKGDDQHHSDKPIYYQAADTDVLLEALKPGLITVAIDDISHDVAVQLDGTHNAINATAALAATKATLPTVPTEKFLLALSDIEPAFGRGERIQLQNGAGLKLQLVKNPAGFTHALRLLEEKEYSRVGIVINDDYADGRDVSWLWDVDFTSLPSKNLSTGGIRAHDMALRLKYEGIAVADIQVNLGTFLRQFVHDAEPESETIIFTTYTAMLQLRRMLKAHGHSVTEVGV